jgi:hypothetical protein
MLGGIADSIENLDAGGKGGENLFAAGTQLLAHGDSGRYQDGSRMHSNRRHAQIVEFKRMRQGAIGKRRHRGLDFISFGTENTAASRTAGRSRMFDDHLAPGKLAAERTRGDSINDAKFRPLDDVCRNLIVGQLGGKFGQSLGRVHCHFNLYFL